MMQSEDSLPYFGDVYRQYFNPITEAYEIRSRSKGGVSPSLSEIMEYIDIFLRRHQTSFIPHKTDKNIVLFPYMFVSPREGDRFINKDTKEIYTVDQVVRNPKNNLWEGAVRLALRNAPSMVERHVLVYEDTSKYINFDHVYPSSIANLVGTNSEDMFKNLPPMKPTITWKVSLVEPGGLERPFSSRKERKPRLRESLKDPLVPGYTVQVSGHTFDNLVNFECWSNDHRTSERLVRWFENFMKTYSPYFRQCGVNNMFFWQRTEDRLDNTWRQKFAVKNTQYYFRTDELEANYDRDLMKVDIILEKQDSIQPRLFTEHRYIADQLVTGELTYDEYKNLFYRSGQYLFGDIDIVQ